MKFEIGEVGFITAAIVLTIMATIKETMSIIYKAANSRFYKFII